MISGNDFNQAWDFHFPSAGSSQPSLAAIKGNELQLVQYIAVIHGIRRSLDDWVPADRLSDFEVFLARLGLVVEVDCGFHAVTEPEVKHIDIALTTWATGKMWWTPVRRLIPRRDCTCSLPNGATGPLRL